MRSGEYRQALLGIVMLAGLFTVGGCVNDGNESAGSNVLDGASIAVDIVAACSDTTPEADKNIINKVYDENPTKGVCVDTRYRFSDLHIKHMKLRHLETMDLYVVYSFFYRTQLDELNKFIGTVIDQRIYWVKDGAILQPSVWAMFTT